MNGTAGNSAGRLGVGFVIAGLIVVVVGWNGAAGSTSVAGQVPYLLSGGLLGVALCVLGASLLIIDAQRSDRARLEERLIALEEALVASRQPAPSQGTAAGFVSGPTSYHRADCRLLKGREDLPQIDQPTAASRGLSPCRVCKPQTSRVPDKR